MQKLFPSLVIKQDTRELTEHWTVVISTGKFLQQSLAHFCPGATSGLAGDSHSHTES